MWIALGTIVVWLVALQIVNPGPIADECIHHPAVTELAHGRTPDADRLPMLPTYHYVGAGVVWLLGDSLFVLRLFSAAMTVGALAFWYGAARARHGQAAGSQLLLLAWSPLYLPYSVLAYTEPAALLALSAAVWCYVRRHPLGLAGALLLAGLIRQSNVIWVVFFGVWLLADELDADRWRFGDWPAFRRMLPKLWPPALAGALLGAYLLLNLDWALTPNEANRARFNASQLYLFGLVVIVLWLPLWVGRLWRGLRAGPVLPPAWKCCVVVAATAALALALDPDDSHPWNVDPRFLRNRLTVLLQASVAARLVLAGLIGVVLVPLISHVWNRPARHILLAAWVFAVLFVLPHRLVDHRYYIFPVMFVHFCTRYTPGQCRALCVWSLVLSVAVAAYQAVFGGLDAGL